MSFITVANVRYASGAPVSLISNTAIESAITIVEATTSKKMNTKFVPTRRIDIMDGTGTNRFFTEKNPVLKILSCKSDGNAILPNWIDASRNSGLCRLNEDSNTNVFVAKQNALRVAYLFGHLVPDDDNRTTTNGAVSAGSAVVITVDDAQAIAVNDWIEIMGTDGKREVAKVTAITDNDITVDLLNFAHEDESVLYKIQIPYEIKRFMELEAAIYVGINAIGATYTFNASYSVGDLSVVKGVPYTHWRESVQRCIQEREALRKYIKAKPSILVN